MDKRVEQLESEIKALRKDFSDISKSLKSLAEQKSDELESRAKQAWDELSAESQEYYAQARDYVNDGVDSLDQCIRDKPWQSLAVVAGIGFFIGFLTRR
ncbi:hypothetical protein L0B52_00185 [Suttonella sp. R2A3]|uniref:DUF883 family protein n=1 Tax=Suttonella sp. R2A3 TaxID=2908648 RepID=UPI001F2A0C1F|nr:hypothetical protein [Suttonella sp. R2A3]UJF24595.1 hypothetical protein L0B52_00185 [Suttonella sp. R2A3]